MEYNIAKIIELPKICDPRGNLSFLEGNKQIPFDILRSYWIYDVPGGQVRNGHAFHSQQEFIIALSGSFDVVLNNGAEEQTFHMSRSYYGLYVPRMMWRELKNFSTNSVALILSSTIYNPDDYIEEWEEYIKLQTHEM